MAATRRAVLGALLDRHGRTYADEAGIRLTDKPSPLYRLLVLATLLSARITADIAVAAARELSTAGYRTPRAMRDATWQQRVDALGRGHYRRYDERTATMLGDGAQLLLDEWRGDLRRLRDDADGDVRTLRELLIRFPGIGPTGAAIFLREVQATWPEVAPFCDERMAKGASALGLPSSATGLAGLVGPDELPRLAAALVRVALHGDAAQEVRAAA
ncbi:MAG: hypothetical protein WCA46_13985 [Actinocatenispora sp.]